MLFRKTNRSQLWLFCLFLFGAGCLYIRPLIAVEQPSYPKKSVYTSACNLTSTFGTEVLSKQYSLSFMIDGQQDEEASESGNVQPDNPSAWHEMTLDVAKQALAAEPDAGDIESWTIQCSPLRKIRSFDAYDSDSNGEQKELTLHHYNNSDIIYTVAKMDKRSREVYLLEREESVSSGAAKSVLAWRTSSKAVMIGAACLVASAYLVPPLVARMANYPVTYIITAAIGGIYFYYNEKPVPILHHTLVGVLHGGVSVLDKLLTWIDGTDALKKEY